MGGKREREGEEDGAEVEIEYERLRNARLAENQKRMEELGLVGLSKSLSDSARSPGFSSSRSSTPRSASSIPRVVVPPGPARRSSRLQGSPVVSYAENIKRESEGKEKKAGRRASEAGTGGFQPEIYTEEDEKLLGSAEKEWQLFVDGYDANGTRIYDPVRGKTCHQCRQKTMGLRTSCSCCQSLHGQFCGDCLYMRYGENVVEANENKKWTCPVCRKICNCSFCRLRRGWTPTGSLYRKIKSLGYKSVAHYLIHTRRGDDEEKAGDAVASKGDNIKGKGAPKVDEVKEEKSPLPAAAGDVNIDNPVVAESLRTPTPDMGDIVEGKAAPSPAEEDMSTESHKTRKPGKVAAKVEVATLASKEGNALESGRLSQIWKTRAKGSVREKPKEFQIQETNAVVGNEAGKADEEPKKRGRGRPRKNPPSGKGSFYASAPRTLVGAKPEPGLGGELPPILVVDSETDEDLRDLKENLVNTLTIAQRLQKRRAN